MNQQKRGRGGEAALTLFFLASNQKTAASNLSRHARALSAAGPARSAPVANEQAVNTAHPACEPGSSLWSVRWSIGASLQARLSKRGGCAVHLEGLQRSLHARLQAHAAAGSAGTRSDDDVLLPYQYVSTRTGRGRVGAVYIVTRTP